MSKKTLQILCIVATIIGSSACQKENKKTDTPTPAKPKSKLELLCNTWILSETYENNVRKTENGTGEYQFTKQGAFRYKYNGNWTDAGTYDFTGDSAAIRVIFMGTTAATQMKLDQMDEKVLNTSFSSGGKNYLYKYKR